MDLHVASRYAKPAFALLVSLSVAGTCLAAPALAAGANDKASGSALGILAASADAARDAEDAPAAKEAPAAAEAPAAEDSAAQQDAASDGVTVFGGLQLQIPDDYTVTKAASMLLATNDDGSVVINLITPGSMGVGMLDEVEDVAEFFGAMADEAAAGAEGTITDEVVVTLADGTEAYACTLEVESAGSQIVMHQFYVPVANGSFALAQFAYEASADEATVDLVADIADSLQVAPEGAAGADEATFSVFEGAGLKLEVADSLVLDATTVDTEPTWYSEDGTMMFGLIPQLMDGASLLTDDDYAMLYTEIAASLGGEPWETTTVAADGVDVKLGGFSFEDEGNLYVGILGLVTAADDTLTGIMALMPADQVDVYGPLLDTMYESVSVLA